ncbi:MAG: aldo/keto reductase, partial [Nocardioides sp.]|nr:aldo/keto reductase [Nocardioides sp.]
MKRLSDVKRIGYGAMRLTGPHIMGPPKDPDEARRVLRRAIELGVDHIDTSDYYGPYVANDLIREALHPDPPELVLVTKVGARRSEDGGWHPAFSPDEIKSAVHDNLGRLAVERLGAVNLRKMDGWEGSMAEQWTVLADLR